MSDSVGVVMGSDSDWPVMEAAVVALGEFGVEAEVDVVSAHRMPTEMLAYGRSAVERGLRVLIDATVCARGARIAVWNSTREPAAGEPARRDRRRRNGLRIVSSIAAEHGGRFVTHRSARAWTCAQRGQRFWA